MLFNSSALISSLCIMERLCDGWSLLLDIEPVSTVRYPSAFAILSAVCDVGENPPAIVIWQLS